MLQTNTQQTTGRRILIIGDSLVAGEGAADSKGWAQQVAKTIGADTLGVPGATSREILNHLPSAPYDRVIVQIGTNDARYRHAKNATETSREEFYGNLDAIVRHFRAVSGAVEIVFVDLLFVEEQRTVLYRPDRSYFERDLRQAANVLAQFCEARDHRLISLRSLARGAERLTDGLHPEQTLHDEMAAMICGHLDP